MTLNSSGLPITSLLRGLVIIVGASILAVVIVSILVPENTALVLQILAIATPSTAAILAMIQSTQNNVRLAEVKQQVAVTTAVASSTNAAVSEVAQTVAAASVQTSQGLDGVNEKVDGHLTNLMIKLDGAFERITLLERALIATRVQAAADTKASEIALAVAQAAPAVGSSVPAGSTPPRGTPVAPDTTAAQLAAAQAAPIALEAAQAAKAAADALLQSKETP